MKDGLDKIKMASMKDIIEAIKKDHLKVLESEDFFELSPRHRLYAIYSLLSHYLWEKISIEKPNNLDLKPMTLRAPRFFLHEPFKEAHELLGNYTERWLTTTTDREVTACLEAGTIIAEHIRERGEIGSPREIFIKRFKQGVASGIDQSFKLPVLIWQLCDGDSLSQEEFLDIVESSQTTLNFLATIHLKISSKIDATLEAGDNQSTEKLDGYKPEYFEVVTNRGKKIIKPRSNLKNQTTMSPQRIKKGMEESDPTLKEKTIGCPAFHVQIIKPMSLTMAKYFWCCMQTTKTASAHYSSSA